MSYTPMPPASQAGLDSLEHFDYEPLLLNARVRRIEINPTGRSAEGAPRRRLGQTLRSIAELCCVLEFAGSQHYPPSWVEALTSLGQVVIGSATPVGASQWGFCRCGSRAKLLGSRGYIRVTAGRERGTTRGQRPMPLIG